MTKPVMEWPRGEDHAQHILTTAEVIEIRELARKGSHSLREIGEIFGVSKATVFDLKTKRTWKHVWENDGSQNAKPSTEATE
jgi:transposase